jgi:hypothetical protein
MLRLLPDFVFIVLLLKSPNSKQSWGFFLLQIFLFQYIIQISNLTMTKLGVLKMNKTFDFNNIQKFIATDSDLPSKFFPYFADNFIPQFKLRLLGQAMRDKFNQWKSDDVMQAMGGSIMGAGVRDTLAVHEAFADALKVGCIGWKHFSLYDFSLVIPLDISKFQDITEHEMKDIEIPFTESNLLALCQSRSFSLWLLNTCVTTTEFNGVNHFDAEQEVVREKKSLPSTS